MSAINEVVANVRAHMWHRDDDEFQCAEHRDGPDTCDCGSDDAYRALLAHLATVEAERDALRAKYEPDVTTTLEDLIKKHSWEAQ